MSKVLQISLFATLGVALAILYFLHFSAQRTVYVDSAYLVNNYKGMVDARKVYQQKANTWKANVDTLANDVQQAIKDYEKESVSMTSKEKELSRELIKSKQKQLSDYQRAIQDKASQEDGKMTQQVLSEINNYVKEYGEKHNYKIIFAATEYGNIAYAQDGLDITEDVLEGLNKQYSEQ